GGCQTVSRPSTRGAGVGAVCEGVALNPRWLLAGVERFTRQGLEPIRFIGGGARSGPWCQIFADVLGRTIEPVTDPVNANARGAGMLAAVALGELTFDEIPDRVTVSATHRPDPRTAGPYTRLHPGVL